MIKYCYRGVLKNYVNIFDRGLVASKHDFNVEWLQHMFKNPFSLKKLCRAKISQTIGKFYTEKINDLKQTYRSNFIWMLKKDWEELTK